MTVSKVKQNLWCEESMLEAVKSIEDDRKILYTMYRLKHCDVEL